VKDVKECSVKWTHWNSNRECPKYHKLGKPSSSIIITANINTSHQENALPTIHIKILHTSYKYITLLTKSFSPNQFYQRAALFHFIIPSAVVINAQSFLQQARK